jgi:hypothetical protein
VYVVLLVAGCSHGSPPYFEDGRGLHIAPPPGWVERERVGAAPVVSGRVHTKGGSNLPLPALGPVGGAAERLLVRYDRVTAGRLAWMRVTFAEAPPTVPLEECAAAHSPGPEWGPEGQPENLQMTGQAAARAAFKGRWAGQDYLCETVAVRTAAGVYCFTASYPAADESAGGDVQQALAGVTWK